LSARENRNVFSLDFNVPSELLSVTWQRVPAGRSGTAESTLGKSCTGERFGQSSGRGEPHVVT